MDPNELLEALTEATYSDLCQAIVDKKGLRDGRCAIEAKAGRVYKIKWSEDMDLTPHTPRVDEVVDPNQITIFEYDGDPLAYDDLDKMDRIKWNFAIGDLATFVYFVMQYGEYKAVVSNGEDYDEAENRIEIVRDQEADDAEKREEEREAMEVVYDRPNPA